MKKRFLILFAVILFCLTGCIKYNAVMDIKEDKSMDFSIIYAIQKSLMEMSDDTTILSDDDRKNLENNGFSIEDYSDEKMVGFRISKMISNIDEVSSGEDIEYSLSKIMEPNTSQNLIFKIEKGSDKDTYTANFTFDASDSELSDSSENDDDVDVDTTVEGNIEGLDQLGDAALSSLDLKFIVKLPNAVISDNATSKSEDGKELTWDLSAQKEENISFQFAINHSTESNSLTTIGGKGKDSKGNNNIFLYVIIGGCVGLVLVVLLLIVAKNSGKNRNLSNDGNMNSSATVSDVSVNKVASGVEESSVNESVSSEEVASGVEEGSVNESVSSEKVASGVEEGSVNESVSSEEVASGVEEGSVNESVSSEEVASGVEESSVNESVSSEEVASGVEESSVNESTSSEEVVSNEKEKSISEPIFPAVESSFDVGDSTKENNDIKVDNSEIFPRNDV